METLTKHKHIESNRNIQPYIETYTGRKFFFLDPSPEMFHIEDIAHALSLNCRFTGHINEFYSVAEHSLAVSYLTDDPLEGLLHDLSEAYLTDIARPIKQYMPEYYNLENRIMRVASEKFGFSYPISANTKDADNAQLKTEALALLSTKGKDWVDDFPTKIKAGVAPECLSPKLAEAAFLERYYELIKN
jgi:hypothetical protein